MSDLNIKLIILLIMILALFGITNITMMDTGFDREEYINKQSVMINGRIITMKGNDHGK